MEAVRPFTVLLRGLVCDALFSGRVRVPTPDMMSEVLIHCKMEDQGKVIICGGLDATACNVAGHLIKMGRVRWSTSKTWYFNLVHHKIAALKCGTVLVTGGVNLFEIEMPKGLVQCCRLSWHQKEDEEEVLTSTSDMHERRYHHAAVALHDGRVMVTGGLHDELTSASRSMEFYDPDTQLWTLSDTLLPIQMWGHVTIALANGLILICGGQRDEEIIETCWLYDPHTDTFTETGSMLTPRMRHSCVLLPDGRVMAIAGRTAMSRGTTVRYEIYDSCEFYDPMTGRWSPAPRLLMKCYDPVCFVLRERVVVLSSQWAGAAHYVFSTQKWTKLAGVPSATQGCASAHFY